MQRFKLLLIVASVMLLAASGVQAAGRCPAGESNCTFDNAGEKIKERVSEGKDKVIKNESPDGRVKEVGKTLRDCLRCGMEGIQDGMDRVTGKKKNNTDMD